MGVREPGVHTRACMHTHTHSGEGRDLYEDQLHLSLWQVPRTSIEPSVWRLSSEAAAPALDARSLPPGREVGRSLVSQLRGTEGNPTTPRT